MALAMHALPKQVNVWIQDTLFQFLRSYCTCSSPNSSKSSKILESLSASPLARTKRNWAGMTHGLTRWETSKSTPCGRGRLGKSLWKTSPLLNSTGSFMSSSPRKSGRSACLRHPNISKSRTSLLTQPVGDTLKKTSNIHNLKRKIGTTHFKSTVCCKLKRHSFLAIALSLPWRSQIYGYSA